MANTIWGRLWESTEGDLVTIRLPRALAEELLAAISAGCESGDGLDMDLDGDDGDGNDGAIDLDLGDDDDDGPGVDMLLVGDDDEGEDEKDDEEEDDEDDKDEGGKKADTRPKTALGESRSRFQRLKGRLPQAKQPRRR